MTNLVSLNNSINSVKRINTNSTKYKFSDRSLKSDSYIRINKKQSVSFNGNLFGKLNLHKCEFVKKDIDPIVQHCVDIATQTKQCFDKDSILYAKKMLLGILQDPSSGCVCIVKDNNDNIIATGVNSYIKAKVAPDKQTKTAFLWGLFVRPDFHKKGIGSHIMDTLLEDGKKSKCDFVALTVENPIAHKMYKKIGFNDRRILSIDKILMLKKL